MAADPYATLGLARGAGEADIKKAYRKLAKELHPDRNQDNPKAADRFAAVTAAYDLLSDKDKRARFDRGEIDGDGNPSSPFGFGGGGGGAPHGGFRGAPGGGFEFSSAGGDFGDIFDGLFGGRARGGGFGGFGRGAPPPPARGANVAYRLAVSFEDAARLAPQRVRLGDGSMIDLKLPPGLEHGMQVRLSGKGEAGPAGPGDAMVTIDIRDHPFFERDGDHVRLELPVTLREAVLGGPVKVPTVEGPVMLNIPAGSSSGRTLRLKGRGWTGRNGRGDQLVTLQVIVPADDAALRQWAENATDLANPRAKFGV